jgi:hypothetical protein
MYCHLRLAQGLLLNFHNLFSLLLLLVWIAEFPQKGWTIRFSLYPSVVDRSHYACWPQSLSRSGNTSSMIVGNPQEILEEQLRHHLIHLFNIIILKTYQIIIYYYYYKIGNCPIKGRKRKVTI